MSLPAPNPSLRSPAQRAPLAVLASLFFAAGVLAASSTQPASQPATAAAPATSTQPASRPGPQSRPKLKLLPTQEANLTMARLKVSFDSFFIDTGRFPSTLEGFSALLESPSDVKAQWKGPYLEQIPKDPWGHLYIYEHPGRRDTLLFDLSSAGPDGNPGTRDDLYAR